MRQAREDEAAAYSASDRVSVKRTPATCMVCQVGSEDPWHLVNDCPGSASDKRLTDRRSEARVSARRMLLDLIGCIADTDHSLTALAEAARSTMAAMRWDSQEGRWLLFRLMAVLPFPAAAAAPGHAAVAALGALFDACRFDSRRLAPVAQLWVTWAVKHSHALGKARVEAYHSPEVAARGAAQAARDRDTALPSRSARHNSRRASNA